MNKGLHRQFSEIEANFAAGECHRSLADELLCEKAGFMDGYSSKKIIGYTRSALRYLQRRGCGLSQKELREIYATNFFVLSTAKEAAVFARELGLQRGDIRLITGGLLAECVDDLFAFTQQVWEKLNGLRKFVGCKPLSKTDHRVLKAQVATAYRCDAYDRAACLAESLRFLGWELLPYAKELHRHSFAELLAGTDDEHSPFAELYAGRIINQRMTKEDIIGELAAYGLQASTLVGWPELAKYGAHVENVYFREYSFPPTEAEHAARLLYLLKVLANDEREWLQVAEQTAYAMLGDSNLSEYNCRVFSSYGFDLQHLVKRLTDREPSDADLKAIEAGA